MKSSSAAWRGRCTVASRACRCASTRANGSTPTSVVSRPATHGSSGCSRSAPPGRHLIEARAFDGTGDPPTAEPAPVAPDGAQGYHRVAGSTRLTQPVCVGVRTTRPVRTPTQTECRGGWNGGAAGQARSSALVSSVVISSSKDFWKLETPSRSRTAATSSMSTPTSASDGPDANGRRRHRRRRCG